MQTDATQSTKKKNNTSAGTKLGKCQEVFIPPQRLLPDGTTVNFGNGPVPSSKNSGNTIGNKRNNRKKLLNQKQTYDVISSSDLVQEQVKGQPDHPSFESSSASRGGDNRITPKAGKERGPTTRPNTLRQGQNQTNKQSRAPRVAEATKYAGSSFHQSPSAVSLPKPSFL
ncbi:BA75_04406T0 [Komagataella pastoris]|uniref:BA75_04406T0 n=1 Tax=Komagataella pastoris TaxID=4922 RepID=A0A1B2JI75_PICPA|nr:BA75_04406T0 [Komagataella pastoris]